MGGTLDPAHSASVAVTGHVERLTDGRVMRKGPAYTGMTMDAGPSAVLAIGTIRLLLMSRTIPTSDPEIYRAAGLGAGHRAYRRGQIAQPLPRRLRTVRPGHHPARHTRREQP